MLTSLRGFACIDADCAAPLASGLSPLVTIQRSAQKSEADAAANLAISLLLIEAPRPSSSSWRDLHWIAMYFPSLQRVATASIPTSNLVVFGKCFSLSGHSSQCQHSAMSHSLMYGPDSTVTTSSHSPSVSCGFISSVLLIAASMMSCAVEVFNRFFLLGHVSFLVAIDCIRSS